MTSFSVGVGHVAVAVSPSLFHFEAGEWSIVGDPDGDGTDTENVIQGGEVVAIGELPMAESPPWERLPHRFRPRHFTEMNDRLHIDYVDIGDSVPLFGVGDSVVFNFLTLLEGGALLFRDGEGVYVVINYSSLLAAKVRGDWIPMNGWVFLSEVSPSNGGMLGTVGMASPRHDLGTTVVFNPKLLTSSESAIHRSLPRYRVHSDDILAIC